jgi:hypothetical protein
VEADRWGWKYLKEGKRGEGETIFINIKLRSMAFVLQEERGLVSLIRQVNDILRVFLLGKSKDGV